MAVVPSTSSFTSPAGIEAKLNRPCASVTAVRLVPIIETVTPAIGSLYTSSLVPSTLSAPEETSSFVPGFRSGPGSATTPDKEVFGSETRLTVLKL